MEVREWCEVEYDERTCPNTEGFSGWCTAHGISHTGENKTNKN